MADFVRETNHCWRWFTNGGILVLMLGASLCCAVGCPSRSPQEGASQAVSPRATGDSSGKASPNSTAIESTEEPLSTDPGAASENAEENDPNTLPDPVTESQEPEPKPDPQESSPAESPEVLFQDWPKPEYVLFLTGRQHGYIEPCGCTGLENQKGGLARRDTLLAALRAKSWDVVPMDIGNQVRRFGRQPEIKFQLTVSSLQRMQYRAVALGPDDLKLPAGELVALVADGGDDGTPFVAANVVILDRSLLPEHHVIRVGGRKIGVTAVLGDSQQKSLNNGDLILEPMVTGLRRVWPMLKAARCDAYVLLCHGSLAESRALAKEFPQFNVVVTAGGSGPPTFEPEVVEPGGNLLVQVGPKGMYAGALGFFAGPGKRFRYQRIALSARFKDSPAMLAQLKTYQGELQRTGLSGLGIQPVAHPRAVDFVGSRACGECHTKAYEVWENTPHAHATDSLVSPPERQDISRHFDPECLSCHVTGWNPQKFFPYRTGYQSLQETLAMKGSGCENCHGPGGHHVAAENGDLEVGVEKLMALRQQMQISLKEARTTKCMECHDLDNSPDFHDPGAFDRYWEQVRHPGKD